MKNETEDNQSCIADNCPQRRPIITSMNLYAKGGKLVSQLYVDPLPGDHVLRTLLKPNTTFLVGRKGTGKSTIFQRAQDELREPFAWHGVGYSSGAS